MPANVILISPKIALHLIFIDMKKTNLLFITILGLLFQTLTSCNTSKRSVVFVDDVYFNPSEARKLALQEEKERQKRAESEGMTEDQLASGRKVKPQRDRSTPVSSFDNDPAFRMSYGAYFNRFGSGYHYATPAHRHRNQWQFNYYAGPSLGWGFNDPWMGYNGFYDPYCHWGGGFGNGFHQPFFMGMHHNPYQAGFMNGFVMGQNSANRPAFGWGGSTSGFTNQTQAQPIMVRRTSYGTNQTAQRRDNHSGYGTVKSPGSGIDNRDNSRASTPNSRSYNGDRIERPAAQNRPSVTGSDPTSNRSSSGSSEPTSRSSSSSRTSPDRSAEPSPQRTSPPPSPPVRESTPSRTYNQPSSSPPRTYSPPPSSSGTNRGSTPSVSPSSGGSRGGSSSGSSSSGSNTNRGGRR